MNLHIAKSLFAQSEYESAFTLVRNIVTNDSVNVGARILMAKILAKQGRLAEAIRIVIQNFSIEPTHLASRRFLGCHIINSRQVELLKTELGDNISSSDVIFYLGHCLYEFGACVSADSLLREAWKMNANSTVAVGVLLNFLMICPNFDEFKQLYNEMIVGVLKKNGLVSLVDALNLGEMDSDFLEVREISIGPLPEKLGIEHLDAIWMTILIGVFLFCRGFVKISETVCRCIKPLIDLHDFNSTALKEEIAVFESLAYGFGGLNAVVDDHNMKAIYVIGDENVFRLGWHVVNFEGENYRFVPIYIRGIRSYNLVGKRKCAVQYSYVQEMNRLPDGSLVILSLSKLELRNKLLDVDDPELPEVRETAVSEIARIARQIVRMKKCRVWVHPLLKVDVGFENDSEIEEGLNQLLGWTIWTLNKNMGEVRMLDAFDSEGCLVKEPSVQVIGAAMQGESRLDLYATRELGNK
jgi:hypothetical protein